ESFWVRWLAETVERLGDHGHWFAVGDIDETAVRSLTRDLPVHPIVADTARRTGVPVVGPNPGDIPDGYLVKTSAALTAELTEDPLRQAAVLVFRVGTAGAGAFALIAALLTLVRAAPDRSAALARLRTMGLRPRQGLALILVETLPQTLLAAVGGLLASLAAVVLLGPALDLSALLGTDVPPGLPLRLGAVLPPALALTALVTAGVLAEALIAGRRQIAKELRAGDTV
ncbi:ABC transporter permease, partial [Kitasatospora purpeofusca]